MPVSEKRLGDYREIIGPAAYAELLALGSKLRGRTVAHVSATPYGGGVAELLHSVVPLQRDLGLDARWFVMSGSTEFFNATKTLHNALQGSEVVFSPDELSTYRQFAELNAAEFQDEYDYVVIHDPQPAPLVALCEHRGTWIWRCHLDLTHPNRSVLGILTPYLQAYDGVLFSATEYEPRNLGLRRVFIVPPAIDPTSPKNRHVDEEERETILSRLEFDPERPILSQVGRFDPWKDPKGVIDVYRLVKKKIPELQLLFVSAMALDDPEGWLWYERSARYAGEDEDLHFLTDLRGVHALEVNVIQRETDVALVKSLREGFGLVVSESLWKRVPVLGGDVGGIRLQIKDGRHGYLVSSVRETADRAIELLRNEDRRKAMGKAGREHVRRHFLITRYLRDYLRIFLECGPRGGTSG